jgi:hypothetical protein
MEAKIGANRKDDPEDIKKMIDANEAKVHTNLKY